MTPEDFIVWRNILIILGIVAVLWALSVLLCREFVKSDLRDRIYTPIRVRWRPFAASRLKCRFKVMYSDYRGEIHRATCETSWHRRDVRWFDDEIIGERDDSAAS